MTEAEERECDKFDAMTQDGLREAEKEYREQAARLTAKANHCRAIRLGRDAQMMLNEAYAARRRARDRPGEA
jgi:hypothetical protein